MRAAGSSDGRARRLQLLLIAQQADELFRCLPVSCAWDESTNNFVGDEYLIDDNFCPHIAGR